MKTCPECAESIQDAARKCRFCGFRFDGEAQPRGGGAAQAVDVADDEAITVPSVGAPEPAAPAPAATGRARAFGPSWGFLLTALGGALIFVGAIASAIALAVGVENVGSAVQIANLGGYVVGGVLLAIGWGFACAHGQASIGGVAGALVLVAGQLWGLGLAGSADWELLRSLVSTGSVLLFLYLHLGTLEKAGFDGTRLAAMVSMIGFGGVMFFYVKKLVLPAWIGLGLVWIGVGGLVLFGLALAGASVQRLGQPR